jgi:maltoporin
MQNVQTTTSTLVPDPNKHLLTSIPRSAHTKSYQGYPRATAATRSDQGESQAVQITSTQCTFLRIVHLQLNVATTGNQTR